jgi:uncharacterized damage-inducible protein DinB
MSSDVDRYRRWFEYEQDAHAKVVRSLEGVPADRRNGPEFRRAVGLLAHIAAARRIWLWRLGAIDRPPDSIFPETADVAAVAEELRALQQRWADYLGGVTDADLDRTFEYRSLDGRRWRNRVEDVLTQLFGHSWYHRGQIAMLVRAAGGEPAATDLVYWSREPLPPG